MNTIPMRTPFFALAPSAAGRLVAVSLLAGLCLSGCNRAEAPTPSQPGPASSAPGSPAASSTGPAGSSPAGGASATATPGTAEGAANSLPPSTSAGTTSSPSAGTAVDSKSNNPRGDLSKQQEDQAMPRANQANNHSSPALDTDAAKR